MGYQPYARVDMAIDAEYYGQVTYTGDSLSWFLPQMLGRPDVTSSGFEADPTGKYVIQQRQRFMLDADETLWTTGGNDTGTYTHGTNPATGKKFLQQQNGALTTISDTVYTIPHGVDSFGALSLVVTRGEPPSSPTILNAASYNFYLYFSWGNPAGTVGLRLAIEAGAALRLQASSDNVTWADVDTAAELGDSETYLNRCGRQVSVEVLPLTDVSYWNAYAASLSLSGPPENKVVVILNGGDAILEFALDQAPFAPGNVAVTAVGGQWSLEYGIVQFAPTANMGLPALTGRVPFQTLPSGDVEGYEPYGSAWSVTPNQVSSIQCAATLEVQAPTSNIDPLTGYATSTLVLSYAKVDFPYAYQPVSYGSATASFDLGDITNISPLHAFSQSSFMRRSSAGVTINDSLQQLAPLVGSPIGVRAAFVTLGLQDVDTGANSVVLNLSGLTSNDDSSRPGLKWWYDRKQARWAIAIADRFNSQTTVGRMRAFDRQCHYYVVRQLLRRMNFIDDWMNFPVCGRDSDCSHYHLPGGTNGAPILQPDQSDTCMYWLQMVRRLAGETDYATGLVQPMYLMQDQQGFVQYFPAPVGIVQTWINPDMSFGQSGYSFDAIYSAVPGFDLNGEPLYNEIRSLQTSANLSNMRTSIAMEGINPFDGSINIAYLNNPALIYDPSTPGYIGHPAEYVDISRYFTTPQAAYIAAQVAAVQMSFPSIGTTFEVALQSGILPITASSGLTSTLDPCIVGVQDFYTQGTVAPVAYYPTVVDHRINFSGRNNYTESTTISARLIGQAA